METIRCVFKKSDFSKDELPEFFGGVEECLAKPGQMQKCCKNSGERLILHRHSQKVLNAALDLAQQGNDPKITLRLKGLKDALFKFNS